MSEEIAAADANIREIQRLRGLLAASQEREQAAAEEKQKAWTDAAVLKGLMSTYRNAREHLERDIDQLSDAEVLTLIRKKKNADDLLGRAVHMDYPGAQIHRDLADLRAALLAAQAELDRTQPIVIAAARLASGPDATAWQALYQALEQAGRDVAPQK